MLTQLLNNLSTVKDFNFLNRHDNVILLDRGLEFAVFEHKDYPDFVIKVPQFEVEDYMKIEFHDKNNLIKNSYSEVFLPFCHIDEDCRFFVQEKMITFESVYSSTEVSDFESNFCEWVREKAMFDKKSHYSPIIKTVFDKLKKFEGHDFIDDFHFGNLGICPKTGDIKLYDFGCF